MTYEKSVIDGFLLILFVPKGLCCGDPWEAISYKSTLFLYAHFFILYMGANFDALSVDGAAET